MVTAMYIYLFSEHIFNKLNSLTYFDVKLYDTWNTQCCLQGNILFGRRALIPAALQEKN
jgi:hypothetical protein